MTTPRAYRARAALLAVLATTAACTDRSPTGPGARPPGDGGDGPGGPTATIAVLTCTASMQDKSVSCTPADPSTGPAAGLIVGHQGINVQLTSSNLNYNSGTGSFTFDATLQNLIEQPLGTTDGVTQDPAGIRIFFSDAPTVAEGTGSVSVIPDGFATFTAPAQAYYTYPYVLDDNETSAAEGWSFVVPPTVTRFVFTVLVSAPVQFPTGYITLNGELPGASYGSLHPTTPTTLTAVVKDAYGVTQPGTVTFGTTDAMCATVDGGGTVSGVRAGTCSITATSGSVGGELVFNVTGTGRIWDGSESTSWDEPLNWELGVVPATVDTVLIPASAPLDPVLQQPTSIGGVSVEDGASLSLNQHDLTVSANVDTGLTPGSGILATTGVLELAGTGEAVRGRVPSMRVTGTYSLSGELNVVAPGRVLSGRLLTANRLFRTVSQ